MSIESPVSEDERMDLHAMASALLHRWPRILALTAALLAITFVILLFVPRMYESTAGLLVENRVNALTRTANEQPAQPTIPVEAMMSSQIELIKSRDTLLAVIESENLDAVPELAGAGPSPIGMLMQLIGRKPTERSLQEVVLQNLNDRLTVLRERDSAVISIIVRTTDAELSARIANAIANAHVRRRAGLSLADTAEASEWLEQEIERLRSEVREAEKAVASYRADHDLYAGTNNDSLLNQQLSGMAGQLTAAQERKNDAISRAQLIRRLLDAGQPVEGVPAVRDSVVVQQLSQSRANLHGELAQRSSTLLPNHPTIKALNAQIREIDQQIANEGRRIAEALEAEAEIEEGVETSLRDDLTRLKLTASNAAQDGVSLAELEREAKALRDLLESYLLRHGDAVSRTGTSSAFPDVRVVTLAAPAVQPASPKTALVLGAVAFVSLALQIGGILFGELISGRALTTRTSFSRVEPGIEDSATVLPDLDAATPPAGTVPAEEIDLTATQVTPPETAAAPVEEPSVEEMPAAAVGAGARTVSAEMEPSGLADLAADILAGRVEIVILAAVEAYVDCLAVSDVLMADCLDSGLSVVCVDAGSGHPTEEPGLTDLAAEAVDFGDVVHRVGEGLAEVPWGTLEVLERRSLKPATLLAALSDVYNIAIVATGRIGMASALPLFSGVPCRLVLVAGELSDPASLRSARRDAAALGYDVSGVVQLPEQRAKVA